MSDEIAAPAAPDGDAPMDPIPTEGEDTGTETPCDHPTDPVVEPVLPTPKFALGALLFRLAFKPDPRLADVDGNALGWLAGEVTGIKRVGNHVTYSLDRDDVNWYFEDGLALTKEERLQNLF